MGQIALSIPQTGLANSTEDPKIASDFTTIQTAINGNIDDNNLLSPLTAVRKLLLQQNGVLVAGDAAQAGGTDSLLSMNGPITNVANLNPDVAWLVSDAGITGQPQDFQVANKSAFLRIRGTVLCNSTGPGAGFQIKPALYQLTGVGGSGAPFGGTGLVLPTMVAAFTSLFTSSTVVTAAANNAVPFETTPFGLPVINPTNPLALGLNLSAAGGGGIVVAANCGMLVSTQLYLYHG